MKNLVICPHCHTVNKKKALSDNEVAVCSNCRKILYRSIDENKLFAFSFLLLLFFIITLFLPIVKIDIIGFSQDLNIVEGIVFLYSEGFIFLSLFVLLTIVLFPLICFISIFLLSIFFMIREKKVSKRVLILITLLNDWCFLDIFFIAILVSLIKIISYGSIEIESGFFSYVIVLIAEIYVFKYIGVHSLWEKLENL